MDREPEQRIETTEQFIYKMILPGSGETWNIPRALRHSQFKRTLRDIRRLPEVSR